MLVLGLLIARSALGFNPPIARLPVILKDLSKLAGTELQCAPELDNEVFYINAPSQTPKDIMAQIAYTLEANWVQLEGNKMRLSRPLNWAETQKKRKEARIEIVMAKLIAKAAPKALTPEEMVSEVKRLRDIRSNAMKNEQGFTYALSLKIMELGRQLPAGKLLDAIIMEIGAKKLANVEEWGNAVYSNYPTKMQRPLPKSLKEPIGRYISEHNAITGQLLVEPDPRFGPFGNQDPLAFGRQLSPGIRVLLKVLSDQNSASVQLSVFDGDSSVGHVSRQASLWGGFGGEVSPDVEVPEPPKPGPVVPYSALSLAFFQLRSEERSDQRSMAWDVLKRPFDRDPLQIINEEMLAAYSKESQMPVIALLADEMIPFNQGVSAKEIDLNRYLTVFKFTGGELQERAGWKVFGRSPIAPPRANRRSIQNAIQLADREGRLSVANIAELVAKNPSALDYWMRDYLDAVGLKSGGYYWPYDLARLYGAFSESQKDQLKGGSTVNPENLTANQRRLVLSLLMNENSNLTWMHKAPVAALMLWPTQHLHDGLVSPFGIKADYKSGESWFLPHVQDNSKSPDRPGRIYVAQVEPWTLTSEMAAFQRPDLFNRVNPEDPRKKLKFYKGRSTVWDITFLISEPLDRGGSLRDESYDTKRTYTYADLPEAFRKQAEDQVPTLIARYEKLKAEGRLNPLKKGNPPPR